MAAVSEYIKHQKWFMAASFALDIFIVAVGLAVCGYISAVWIVTLGIMVISSVLAIFIYDERVRGCAILVLSMVTAYLLSPLDGSIGFTVYLVFAFAVGVYQETDDLSISWKALLIGISVLAYFVQTESVTLPFAFYNMPEIVSYLFYFFMFAQSILAALCMNTRMLRLTGAKTKALNKARLDPMTGLYNKQFIYKAIRQQSEYANPCSVIMLDGDRFKSINDNYGHEAGDTVIREMSDVLRAGTRESDLCGRFGGDEFVIVCPNTTAEVARDVASRICLNFSRHVFPFDENLRMTMSMGVSEFKYGEYTSVEDVIAKSDAALYYAKENGKNQVAVYQEGMVAEGDSKK